MPSVDGDVAKADGRKGNARVCVSEPPAVRSMRTIAMWHPENKMPYTMLPFGLSLMTSSETFVALA